MQVAWNAAFTRWVVQDEICKARCLLKVIFRAMWQLTKVFLHDA